MIDPMDDFDPAADRLKQARDAETLARLRAAATDPGAAEKLAASATSEPDPVAVHLGLLKKNFPGQWFPHGWLPDLRDLANLATLRAFFSKKQSVPPRRGEQQAAEGIAELTRHFRRR